MSLKVHFLHAHLDFFVKTWEKRVRSMVRGSIRILQKWRKDTKEDGTLLWWGTIYGHWCVKIKELTVGKCVLQCTSSRPIVAYNLITVILYIFLLKDRIYLYYDEKIDFLKTIVAVNGSHQESISTAYIACYALLPRARAFKGPYTRHLNGLSWATPSQMFSFHDI